VTRYGSLTSNHIGLSGTTSECMALPHCTDSGIWPVKNLVVGCRPAYLSRARCRLPYNNNNNDNDDNDDNNNNNPICNAPGASVTDPEAVATATHSLASVKSRLVLPFWYPRTLVASDKGPLNGRLLLCKN